MLALGADQYLDYRQENYWERVSGVDGVIDALGAADLGHALSVLRPGGRVVSLRAVPNRAYALEHHVSPLKRLLFTAAGAKIDRAARKQGKEYRFLFVRADGKQLRTVTELVEQHGIVPALDPHRFTLAQADEALELVERGPTNGKVLICMEGCDET